MTKRVYIVHGWADDPCHGWINWLAAELTERGIKVAAPAFPDPENPSIRRWLQILKTVAKESDQQTVFVGHSLGCYLVLRYLSEVEHKIGGAVLVAGALPHHRPELMHELDFDAIKNRAAKRICIYSDNDRVIPVEASLDLVNMIEAEAIVDAGKGHFSGLRGTTELPSALNSVLACFD